jgi:Cytochrome c7 and related cytochrome c/Doubled CXXCH motif (Paired_CXXCH_1)
MSARDVGRPIAVALAAVWAVVLALALTVPTTASAQVYARRGPDSFNHLKHAKLFPTCNACHAGVTTGELSAEMPPPSSCTACHDGTIQKRVTYEAPRPRLDFLRFAHRDHAAQVDSSGRDCQTCHALRPGGAWMDVRRATPESCQSCHTHRATAHLAPDSRCATCHVPVARTRTLTAVHLAELPQPPSHTAERFLVNHGARTEVEAAQCATCHARESCARCHVNAADVAGINGLLPDARFAAMLRGKAATYLTPDDHRADAWASAHGRVADARRCAACHARPSCTVCHTGTTGQSVIRQLPDGLSGTAGVQLVLPRRLSRVEGRLAVPAALAQPHAATAGARDTVRTGQLSVVRPHADGFATRHAASASSGRLTCEGCHTQQFCSDCHAGESKRRFHAANFVARHAPESYGRELECSSCHNTEVFCRSCHQAQGLSSAGRRDGTYHNGQPLWLLQHAQAARRGLQSCTTCHVQRDCMQCHSQRGWGVNPHGPDFDASRLGARAKTMCARCHISDPTRGR